MGRWCCSAFWPNGLIYICHITSQNPWICHNFFSCLLPPKRPQLGSPLTNSSAIPKVQADTTSHLGYCNRFSLTSLLLLLFSTKFHTEAKVIFENINFLCHIHLTPFESLLWFSPALRIKLKLSSLVNKSLTHLHFEHLLYATLSLTHCISDMLTFNMLLSLLENPHFYSKHSCSLSSRSLHYNIPCSA